jgi:hypothetical protein
MQRIHESVQSQPEVLISPSFALISESGSGLPDRTLKCFDLISVLFKTYYAMFFLVFATQYFGSFSDTFKFKRRTYFILNATLWGFKPLVLYHTIVTEQQPLPEKYLEAEIFTGNKFP